MSVFSSMKSSQCSTIVCIATFLIAVALLACPHAFANKDGVDDALYGEWQIVEMVYKGKVQDFQGGPGGWIWIEKGRYTTAYEQRESRTSLECVIRGQEIDTHERGLVCKGLYEIKDGTLRIVWRDDYGDRPTSFDAVRDERLTLYVLKRSSSK